MAKIKIKEIWQKICFPSFPAPEHKYGKTKRRGKRANNKNNTVIFFSHFPPDFRRFGV